MRLALGGSGASAARSSAAWRRRPGVLAPSSRGGSAPAARAARGAAALAGRPWRRAGLGLALSYGLLGLLGCTGLGPATIRSDRVDFGEAISDAAQRETLLNIVKLRFADTPSLVSVSQLVAGYSLNGSLSVGTKFFDQTFDFANNINLGAGGSFSENPTVTYTPLAGEDFARAMLTPIPPSELFAMIAAGAPADVIGLGVQSVNGLRNWSTSGPGGTPPDAAFVEVIDLLTTLRRDGLIGFAFETRDGVRNADLLINSEAGAPLPPGARRLVELLRLDPARRGFRIAFGFGGGASDEVKVYTRSLFEILDSLAGRIEVPDSDVADGRTYPTGLTSTSKIPTLRVKHQFFAPGDAFAAVEYRGTWYWIDDRLGSKSGSVHTVLSSVEPTLLV